VDRSLKPKLLVAKSIIFVMGVRCKTYLIKNFYSTHVKFTCSGQFGAGTTEQLINFQQQLYHYFPKHTPQPTPGKLVPGLYSVRETAEQY
jgi:hypothetical protein